ncbi:MAG: hypothetical protein LBJ25_07740 [Candidatus Margulisbacteria bacterium]|jgi:hypothetical protein|nr:hypothetical protein [Candidatus Margulisiibacteriota bacterium]
MVTNNYNDKFEEAPYFIKKGEQLSAAGMTAALNTKENVNNKKDTLSNSNSTEYPSTKAVHDALDLMASEVQAIANAFSGKQDSLPIGTILMYDGTSWQDNVTLFGWYSCNRTNYNNGLTPDLEDKFIKGKGGLANIGGSNALTAAMLPKHTHGFTTSSTSKTLTGSFTTFVIIDGASNGGVSHDSALGILSRSSAASVLHDPAYGETKTGVSGYKGISLDATHTHSGTTSNDNSSATDTNAYNMPAYYSLIYIRRVR